jgi:hypothetical protein
MSGTGYPTGAILKPLLGVLLTLCIFEAALRQGFIKRLLPLPSPYYNEEVLLRTDLLEKYVALRGQPALVVIGSSIARSNVDAEVLSESLGRNCFGLGLSGLPPGSTFLMWEKYWSNRIHKNTKVVHLLRPEDFSYPYERSNDPALQKGRIERGWIDARDQSVLDAPWFPGLRLKDYYGALSKAISSSRRPFLKSPFLTDALGTRPYTVALSTEREGMIRALTSPNLRFKESLQKGDIREILLEFKRALGTRYLVAICPEYVGKWNAPVDSARWESEVCKFGQDIGIPVLLPVSQAFSQDRGNYADFTHFVEQGSSEYSARLGQAILEIE